MQCIIGFEVDLSFINKEMDGIYLNNGDEANISLLPVLPIYSFDTFPYRIDQISKNLNNFRPIVDKNNHSEINRLKKRFSNYNKNNYHPLEYWYTHFSLRVDELFAFPNTNDPIFFGVSFEKPNELEKMLRPVLIHNKLNKKSFSPYILSKSFYGGKNTSFKNKELIKHISPFSVKCDVLGVYTLLNGTLEEKSKRYLL